MKSSLLAVLPSMLFALNVNAIPMSFDIDQSVTQGGSSTDAGGCFPSTLSAPIPGGQTIFLDPGCDGTYLDLEISGGSFSVISGTSALDVFSAGDVVSAATFNPTTDPLDWAFALIGGSPTTNFSSSFTDGYLGFLTGVGTYGYVEADWTYSASSGVGTLFLGSGAVESVSGVGITIATAVPAPATLALFGLGLAGLGWSRRTKA